MVYDSLAQKLARTLAVIVFTYCACHDAKCISFTKSNIWTQRSAVAHYGETVSE